MSKLYTKRYQETTNKRTKWILLKFTIKVLNEPHKGKLGSENEANILTENHSLFIYDTYSEI